MKLEEAILRKFSDGLTRHECSTIHFLREDYLLNNIDEFKLVEHEYLSVCCRVHPGLIRFRQRKNFFGRIKDFIWEDFEKDFLDLTSPKQIEQRIYSNYRSYFVGNRFIEFLVNCNIADLSCVRYNVREISYDIMLNINGYDIQLKTENFRPKLKLSPYQFFDILLKHNPFIRKKFIEKGFMFRQTKGGPYSLVSFYRFSPEILMNKELWNESVCDEILYLVPSSIWLGDDHYYEDYLPQIIEIVSKIPDLKKIFHEQPPTFFYEYSDYQFLKKIIPENYLECYNPPLIDCDGRDYCEEAINELKDDHSNSLYLIDAIRKELKKYPNNEVLWDYICTASNLLFKDLSHKNGGFPNKPTHINYFDLQRRLIRRDFFKEYLIKTLCKLSF